MTFTAKIQTEMVVELAHLLHIYFMHYSNTFVTA